MANPKRIKLKPTQAILKEYKSACDEGTRDDKVLITVSPLKLGNEELIDDNGRNVSALISCWDGMPKKLEDVKFELVVKTTDKGTFTFYIASNSVGECEVVAI